MGKRRWMRRTVLTGAIIVALSVGIVFATLPLLQHPISNSPHGSIQTSLSHTISAGNASRFGYFDVRIPNITISENFYVGVSVAGGTASFCALNYTIYFNWEISYKFAAPPGPPFPQSSCLVWKPQISQDTLMFPVTAGDWAVVALNTSPAVITVSFSPA